MDFQAIFAACILKKFKIICPLAECGMQCGRLCDGLELDLELEEWFLSSRVEFQIAEKLQLIQCMS